MLPKIMRAATSIDESGVFYQTWEEFLKSGVQIEYDDTPTIIDNTENETTD